MGSLNDPCSFIWRKARTVHTLDHIGSRLHLQRWRNSEVFALMKVNLQRRIRTFTDSLGLILLPVLCNILCERVIWIWGAQQGLYATEQGNGSVRTDLSRHPQKLDGAELLVMMMCPFQASPKLLCLCNAGVLLFAHLSKTVRICKAGLHLSLRMSKQIRPSLSIFG